MSAIDTLPYLANKIREQGEVMEDLVRRRNEKIIQSHKDGKSHRVIAKAANLSHTAVHNIIMRASL